MTGRPRLTGCSYEQNRQEDRDMHAKNTVPANAPALGAMNHDEGAPVWRGVRASQASRKTVRCTLKILLLPISQLPVVSTNVSKRLMTFCGTLGQPGISRRKWASY